MEPEVTTFIHTTRDREKIFYRLNFDPTQKHDKPIIIFVYGLVCSLQHFQHQLEWVIQQGFPVMTFDPRGHFRSTGLDRIESLTFENFALDILEICEKHNFQKTILISHSMGVNTSLEFYRQDPQRVLGLVLMSGSVLPPKEIMYDTRFFEYFTPYWKAAANKFPKLYLGLWKYSYRNPLLVRLVHSGGFNQTRVPTDYVVEYLRRMSQLPPHLFFHLFDQMNEHDIIEYLEKVLCPTLVVAGEKDLMIPYHAQKILTQHIPKSELYIVKDGSHVPQIDFPQLVNERLEIFFEKL
jgi:non-heme chloroperoxidase